MARVSFQPNKTYTFTSRFRFDHDTFAVQRTELEANANFDRWNISVLYGDYAAQPLLGFLDRRQGILGSGSVKLDANWVLLGAARYDINAGKFDQTRIGLGYIDDCLILAAELHYKLQLRKRRSGPRPHDHAAVEPAHAGRNIGEPRRRQRRRPCKTERSGKARPYVARTWTLRC